MAAVTSTCMLALLLPVVFHCHAAPPVHLAAAMAAGVKARRGDDKALRALDAWLKLYRSGGMDLRAKDIAKDSIAVKFGIAPKSGLRKPTWLGDLEAILDAVVQLDDANAAQGLLEVAAVGLDLTGKYTLEMAPYAVRAAGEKAIAKLTSGPAKEVLVSAARGETEVKQRMAAAQSAALMCLGRSRDVSCRPVLEQALGAGDEMVRIAAAEALGELGDEAAALPLVALLDRETVDAVLMTAAHSLRRLYAKYLPKAGDASAQPASPAGAPKELPAGVPQAARSATQALGRTTWRADMELIRLLDEFRSKEAVPALITQLERFSAHPEELKSGKLSGLLLCKAHALLVGMTGAEFPADQHEKWRAFWDAEKDKITVSDKGKPAPGALPIAGSSLCGIPVQGTRVAFLLDVSQSMDWPMDVENPDVVKRMKRLDFAKRELKGAIDAMSPSAQFSLITFNGEDKAELWKLAPVPATKPNRESFKKWIDGVRALGSGANLWAGLEEALKVKSVVYVNHSSNFDELFVLSDGVPTCGAVQDPIEILHLVQECNRFACVRINTIFFRTVAPPDVMKREARMSISPQEFMHRMAEQNGGTFKEL